MTAQLLGSSGWLAANSAEKNGSHRGAVVIPRLTSRKRAAVKHHFRKSPAFFIWAWFRSSKSQSFTRVSIAIVTVSWPWILIVSFFQKFVFLCL